MTSEGTAGGGKRRQLGRGLSSLLGDDDDDVAQAERLRQTRMVAIETISPGSAQPRRMFDDNEMQALAESIRERGVLQPILLRRRTDGESGLEIIAGERRWRAAQLAGLHEIPAMVREFTDTEALEIALIENIQRSDLTALEEAQGFQRLIDEYGHTQDDVARAVGKSRSHVANTLRLLSLPPRAREHLEAGRLTAGHARALLVSDDADRLADYVVAGGLSVRATEKLVQGRSGKAARPNPAGASKPVRVPEKDADTRALEQSLTENLGLTVDITQRDEDSGTLTIHYQSLEQLDELLARLTARASSQDNMLVVSDARFGPGNVAEDLDVAFEEDADLDPDGGEEGDPAQSDETSEVEPAESPTEDPETGGNIDFDALMAQTESLLASGEVAGDLDDRGPDRDDTGAETEAADDGGASALISGFLSALDADDPAPRKAKEAESSGDDGPEELEDTDAAGGAAGGATGNEPDAEGPEAVRKKTDPGDDEEIEFID